MSIYENSRELLHQLGQEGAEDFVDQVKIRQQQQKEEDRKRKFRAERRELKETEKKEYRINRKEIRRHKEMSKKSMLFEEKERKIREKQQLQNEKLSEKYIKQVSRYLETNDENIINDYYDRQTYRDNVFLCLSNSHFVLHKLRNEYNDLLTGIKREYDSDILKLTNNIKEQLDTIKLNHKKQRILLLIRNNPCTTLFNEFSNNMSKIHTCHKDDFTLCIKPEHLELITCMINTINYEYLETSDYESIEQIDVHETNEVKRLKAEYNSLTHLIESKKKEKIDILTKKFKILTLEEENKCNENIKHIKNEPDVEEYIDEEYMQENDFSSIDECITHYPQQHNEISLPLPPQQHNEISLPLPPQQQHDEISLPLPPQQQHDEISLPLPPQQQHDEISLPLPPQQHNEISLPLPPQQHDEISLPLPPQQQHDEISLTLPPQQQHDEISLTLPQNNPLERLELDETLYYYSNLSL